MDIDLAQTFLEIAAAGSFVAAAERLNLTQTAISARIRRLEEQVGRRLFVRHRGGARLTDAGGLFRPHALALVQGWERARREMALPAGSTDLVLVGGQFSLWNPLMSDLLVWTRQQFPQLAIRIDIDAAERLLDRVGSGTLDIAVLYSPPPRPDLVVELVLEEKLVLVTASPSGEVRPETYVYIDWGSPFAESHEAAFPELHKAAVSVSLGQLALAHVLFVGGSGYFRSAIARPLIESGRLHPVTAAPEFSYSIYAVHSQRGATRLIEPIRAGLKACASNRSTPVLTGDVP